MRNKKSKAAVQNKNSIHEIAGVLTASLGLFFGLSVYFEADAGAAGPVVSGFLRGLFGIAAYVLPVLIVAAGIMVIMAKKRNINRTKMILNIVTVYFFLCLLHLFFFSRFTADMGLGEFVRSSFLAGKGETTLGTGAFCAPFVYLAYILLGLPGAYIFFITAILVDVLLLTNLSLKQAGSRLYRGLHLDALCLTGRKADRQIREPSRIKKNPFVGEVIPPEQEHREAPSEAAAVTVHREDFNQERQEPVHDIRIIDFQRDKERKEWSKAEERSDHDEHSATKADTPIDVKVQQETLPYMIPPVSLLMEPVLKKSSTATDKFVMSNARLLEDTLNSFGVSAKVVQVSRGPVITRYELQPAPGVTVSRIVRLADDIALNLAAPGVRIEAPIPGKAAVGIEVPNKDIAPVLLREVLESDSFFNHPSTLAFALGKDIAGNNIIADIAKMPHVLIAGATGSGKSVCINTLIVSILYKATPDEVRLIMIDPKVVELSTYNGIPHLLIPVVTDPKKAAGALNWAVQEMTSRYKMFADKGVRDIERYNEQVQEGEAKLPQIVVIIDELADLMMVAPGDVEDAICRLAQMARAAGIHLVIATQRPSVDVITGVIKANIPSRIAFAVSSQTDSRTILDMGGAEKLLGRGDMLFYPSGAGKPIRVQGAFITEKEVESVVSCIKSQNEGPKYNIDMLEETAADQDRQDDSFDDELLPEAIEIVIDAGQASISMLQRRLRIGYARAARLIDEMEVRGLVSGFDGSKPRNVLITKEEFEEQYKDL